MTRHVGAHEIIAGRERLTMAVVDIDCGRVTGWHRLDGEEPFTEWTGGTVVVRRDDGGVMRAYKNELIIK